MKDELDTEKITVRLPKDYLTAIDFLVRVKDFPSRSEAIRTALRDLIYQRLDLVMDKAKRLQDLKDKMISIKALEEEFLKK
jgi:Arc/MetJ-type ribon-helix-helix transcriptional regulator